MKNMFKTGACRYVFLNKKRATSVTKNSDELGRKLQIVEYLCTVEDEHSYPLNLVGVCIIMNLLWSFIFICQCPSSSLIYYFNRDFVVDKAIRLFLSIKKFLKNRVNFKLPLVLTYYLKFRARTSVEILTLLLRWQCSLRVNSFN